MRVVEVTDDVRDQCTQLGAGVVYALRVLCAQLVDDPLRGAPGWDPSMYVVHVDGETCEDCPALDVHYAYGPPALDEGVAAGAQGRRAAPCAGADGMARARRSERAAA
ncbi:hypothetical protein ACFCXR_28095 [Streptomyces noursei]|uniref:hypothetical protein n=1 Tax=Streptomyces noursei TaxID=1971 RepID=UPI0035DA25C9